MALDVPKGNRRHVLAVTLARRIDASDADTSAGLVACIKELGNLMAEIRAAAPPTEESPLDRLRRQHQERCGG